MKVIGSYSKNYSNIQMLKGKKQKQAGILLNVKKKLFESLIAL